MTLNVHCVQAPATAIVTAWLGPSRSSAIRFAAYDTDNVEPLASEIGRFTFQTDVTHVSTTSTLNNDRLGEGAREERRERAHAADDDGRQVETCRGGQRPPREVAGG